MKETYLGDGLYMSFPDLVTIKLRAPRENGDHEVYLEFDTLKTLLESLPKEWKEALK